MPELTFEDAEKGGHRLEVPAEGNLLVKISWIVLAKR